MAKKKVGELIKEARTNAGMTQEQLAKHIKSLTASDISKAERNEKELTQAQLKEIAKATGITQKSLLEAASGTSSTKKTGSSSGTSIKVTTTEKKLLELYRAADSDTKKAAIALLKGEKTQTSSILSSILNNSSIMDTVQSFLTKEQ
ncbi:MAG: helix-turn-helix domain-containing protein [Lachnospiraceae bacterium]|nr:helix-turn-helix domain-containing protein [Lachnospiraceae bacterium]